MSVALPLCLLNHSLLRGLRVTIGLQGSLILDASTVLVALMFHIRSYRGLRAGSFRIKGMAVWVIFEESSPFCISFIPLRCMDHGPAFVFGPVDSHRRSRSTMAFCIHRSQKDWKQSMATCTRSVLQRQRIEISTHNAQLLNDVNKHYNGRSPKPRPTLFGHQPMLLSSHNCRCYTY